MSIRAQGQDLLAACSQKKAARSARVSSWDHSGKNEDAFIVKPGESVILADIEGPGALTHLWFVQACRRILGPGLIPYTKTGVAMMEVHPALGLVYEDNDPDYYRKVIIKMYWDDQEEPSVLAPLGDFFCIGNSMPGNFESLPFSVSVKPSELHKFGGNCGANCYLTMPFNKRARIEIENQGDNPYIQYFYIDYELYKDPLPKDTLYFHAMWRRENPTNGWAPAGTQTNSLETQVKNLDGKRNYVILETEGEGNFIGCNQSVSHFQGGDDMIFVDDDVWPPSFHGTGGEDYFSQGWGMQKNAFSFAGSIIHEDDVPNTQVSYRWHLPDPVRFSKKIKVTMETGHGNHLRDDWSTTAYWYQTLPGPKLSILPVEQRLPRRPIVPQDDVPQSAADDIDADQKALVQQREQRFKDYLADRQVWIDRRAADSKHRAIKNREFAAEIRQRWLAGLN
ncbi:hypothetical protein D1P53_005499 [Cryptococcus gattii VGV]|nr:hypothetical protein D1P53_005499 [Cryptococcus gattii VGV]